MTDYVCSNLIFLSGPHGSGKTKMAEILSSFFPGFIQPELETRTPKFYCIKEGEYPIKGMQMDFFHRQALKYAQKAIENYEYMQYAQNNPSMIVMGNRCIYDLEAYSYAYEKKGWMTADERKKLWIDGKTLMNYYLNNPTAVILNPGFEVCKRHLEKRWKKKDKKFMEEDMEYLENVCNGYEQYRENKNVLYIDKENDIADPSSMEYIAQWMISRSAIDKTISTASSIEDRVINKRHMDNKNPDAHTIKSGPAYAINVGY